VFVFPTLRRRQQRVLNELQARVTGMGQDTTDADANALFDDIESALGDLLLMWDNQTDEDGEPVDFDVADLDRLLDDADLMMLFESLYQARLLTLDQKKASALPPASSSGPSTASLAESLPTEPRATPTGSGVPDATAGTPGGSAGLTGSVGSPSPHGTASPTTPGPLQLDAMESECGCSPAEAAGETATSTSSAIPPP